MSTDEIQVQNMPPDINYDDENALRKLVKLGKDSWVRINDLEERMKVLEQRVLE